MKLSLLTSAALFMLSSALSVRSNSFTKLHLKKPHNWMAGDALSMDIITGYTVPGANYTDKHGSGFAKYVQDQCAPPDCNSTLSFYMEYNIFDNTTKTNSTVSEWRGFTIGAGRPVVAGDLAPAPSTMYVNGFETDVTVNRSMVYNRVYTN